MNSNNLSRIMKILFYVVFTLVLSSAAFAQSIYGVVSDSAGAPVNNVEVSLFDSAQTLIDNTTTNSSGQYNINATITSGVYNLTFNNSGVIDNRYPLVLISGVDKEVNMTLRMAVGTIRGTVDNGTTGIFGAVITASDGANTFTATTDASGNYTFNNLPLGQYNLTAEAILYSVGTGNASLVNDGDSVSRDFTLTSLSDKGSIKATVTSDGTNALEGVSITVVNSATSGVVASGTTNSTGEAAFANISLNDYTVTASLAGYQEDSTTVTLTFANPDKETRLTLTKTTQPPAASPPGHGGGGGSGSAQAPTVTIPKTINLDDKPLATLTVRKGDAVKLLVNGTESLLTFTGLDSSIVSMKLLPENKAFNARMFSAKISGFSKINVEGTDKQIAIIPLVIAVKSDLKGRSYYEATVNVQLLEKQKLNIGTVSGIASSTAPAMSNDNTQKSSDEANPSQTNADKSSNSDATITIDKSTMQIQDVSLARGIATSIGIVLLGILGYGWFRSRRPGL